MLFFYIRHGDPIYDPDSLTALGKRQAEAVARRLALYGIDEIYASTSTRAIQTATPTSEILKKIRTAFYCIIKVEAMHTSGRAGHKTFLRFREYYSRLIKCLDKA